VWSAASESDMESRCPSVESMHVAPTVISQNQRLDHVVTLSRKYRDMVASIDSCTLPMPAAITQLLFLYADHLKENVDEDVGTSADSQTNEQRSPNILDRLILEKQAHHLGFLKEVLERVSWSKNDQLPTAKGAVHEISKSLLELLHDREVAIVHLLGPLQHAQVSEYLPSTSYQSFGNWMGSDSVVDGARPFKRCQSCNLYATSWLGKYWAPWASTNCCEICSQTEGVSHGPWCRAYLVDGPVAA
jgi:hypothetical protein